MLIQSLYGTWSSKLHIFSFWTWICLNEMKNVQMFFKIGTIPEARMFWKPTENVWKYLDTTVIYTKSFDFGAHSSNEGLFVKRFTLCLHASSMWSKHGKYFDGSFFFLNFSIHRLQIIPQLQCMERLITFSE